MSLHIASYLKDESPNGRVWPACQDAPVLAMGFNFS
jgi:hypothetical protein